MKLYPYFHLWERKKENEAGNAVWTSIPLRPFSGSSGWLSLKPNKHNIQNTMKGKLNDNHLSCNLNKNEECHGHTFRGGGSVHHGHTFRGGGHTMDTPSGGGGDPVIAWAHLQGGGHGMVLTHLQGGGGHPRMVWTCLQGAGGGGGTLEWCGHAFRSGQVRSGNTTLKEQSD